MNGKTTTLLALAVGLLLLALASRRAEVAWMAVPLLTTLAFGALRAPRREAIRLTATRRVERGRDGEIAVTVGVRNEGTATLHLRLEDVPRAPLVPSRGAVATRALLPAGGEAQLAYGVRVPRGRLAWTAVRAVATDPLGLLEEHLELPSPGELRVLPEAARFRPLPLRPARTLPSPGSIPARVGGSGTEFFGIREYQVGDALRWIDWRLTARHPGQVFTKEFEQEQIADVGLVLDARGSADDRIRGESLFEHSVRAAASLATAFLRQGDRVSLLVLGEGGERVFPGSGRVHLQRILSCLAAIRVRPEVTARELRASTTRMFPAHSILVVLSPLTVDEQPLLQRLRAHGRHVVLVSPDAVEFHAPVVPDDEVGRLALRAARVERRLRLRAAAQLRIAVVDWQVDRPLYPLMRSALRPSRGGHRS